MPNLFIGQGKRELNNSFRLTTWDLEELRLKLLISSKNITTNYPRTIPLPYSFSALQSSALR
jgi:hypothetical protein